MKNENCNRRDLLLKEFRHDWDELNIAFKALIMVGLVLFLVVILTAIFSDGGDGVKKSLEVVFRTTLASVFGFLLSSNIKNNSKAQNVEIKKLKSQLKTVEQELDDVECELEEGYMDKDINVVQIGIALGIGIICICIIGVLLLVDNVENVPAISQIRSMMCSSIGFLIGESRDK